MGYSHIPNLYKDQTILQFRECFALEKIDGTSAHLKWSESELTFFSGGCKYHEFVKIFPATLKTKFQELKLPKVTIYGEAYGGKIQGKSDVYGSEVKFVAFDVLLIESERWMSVPEAFGLCESLGLEFVHYVKISTDMKELDAQRDADSVQAMRNGLGPGKKREGVILRPLIELIRSGIKASNKNAYGRIIAKHKRDEFRETKTKRSVDKELNILNDAIKIAEEWVTEDRGAIKSCS
jgi:hypothetical protein